MERGVPVKQAPLILALLLSSFVSGVVVGEERRLVLVGSASSSPLAFSNSEVRRIFLGQSTTRNGKNIVPVINDVDPVLYEVFLQKVVFMSARSYERRLLSRVLHRGGKRIPYASQLNSLEKTLVQNSKWISFMWEDTAHDIPGLEILEVLWQGSIQ